MPHRIPTADLRDREYLTVGQAAQVFGRGRDFWTAVFDRGDVQGYKEPGSHGRRYLLAGYVDSWTHEATPGSIRAFLRGQPKVEPVAVESPSATAGRKRRGGPSRELRAKMAAFRRRHAQAGQHAG